MRIPLTDMHVGNLSEVQEKLHELGPAGYSVVLFLKAGGPPPTLSTFPQTWIDIYEQHNLYFTDPVVMWALSDNGVLRWSELPTLGRVASSYVMTRGEDFGLKFGAVASIKATGPGVSKVLISVSRSDRELSTEELNSLQVLAKEMQSTVRFGHLTPSETQILQLLCEGERQEDIARHLKMSPSTLKARLASIRQMMGARNVTHAVALAVAQGLIMAKSGQPYTKG